MLYARSVRFARVEAIRRFPAPCFGFSAARASTDADRTGYVAPVDVAPGSFKRLSATAFNATMMLEPLIEMAAISGRKVSPQGEKTPAAIGRASEL